MLKREAGQPHRPRRTKKPPEVATDLLLRFKLLVRRFYHFVLLRQVDPKLEAARFRLARSLDRHFSMDDWKITLGELGRDSVVFGILTSAALSWQEGGSNAISMVRLARRDRRGLTAHIHCTPPSRMIPAWPAESSCLLAP